MSIGSKFKSFFALDEEIEYVETQQEEKVHDIPVKNTAKHSQNQQQHTGPQNVVSLQSVQKSSKVVLFEPRAYSEAQEIADHLKNRKAVVVNLQRIAHDQAKRIVDFLSGTVYAIGGDIQRIGSNIFLCTPDNVDVSGSITGILQDEESDDLRW
ncbi:cell division protein SepF [Bacillus sp. AGMB 02131]|uniref:Cell division protein SepF n=1 Tax=Peribacillus faecalis TaxID=2772559 RepID=A0A927H9S7_9BACI|nr:cell division protein SepF [Peribacillus faecalis]MBD3106807.1 cell division protein SepF [Peribacillus faecalis]